MMGTDRTHSSDGDGDGIAQEVGWVDPEGPLLDHHLEELLATIGTTSLIMSDEEPADTALGDF